MPKILNEKELNVFKLIVDYYISKGLPVGSSNLIKEYNLKVSSATIRNQMNKLEKHDFLEKAHVSGGRIPTLNGLKFYAEFLATTPNEKILSQIKNIFQKRKINIDETIEEAANLISHISGLTLITTDSSSNKNVLLKSISLTEIDSNNSVVVIVNSLGNVFNKSIELNNSEIKIKDLKIAIRLFQERLVDSKMSELNEKVKLLIPLLQEKVKNCDKIIEAFVNNIFYFEINKSQKVFGKNHIIKSEDIDRAKLFEIIDLIENKSIWESIEEFSQNDEKLKIDIKSSNVSLLSKRIPLGNKTKEISIIGTKRMDYSTAKNVLNTIEDILKEK